MADRFIRPALVVLFILSGAAGLFYESVWSRYLSLFVGHDAYAQVLTLVIFLGGMGVGSLVVSRRSERLRDPLFTYAIVEVAIGALGLAFHDLLYGPVTAWAYERLFPALGGGLPVGLAKWALAGALILPQSILLGATFPLMTAGALRRVRAEPGRTLSILYFANSLGAAAGVLLAGFWLFGAAGLPGTLAAAGILNLVVALGAILVAKAAPFWEEAVDPASMATAGAAGVAGVEGMPPARLAVLLLVLAAGTAVASFAYEIAWIRMLSLVLGSSTHSFELMLSAFILGLALGSYWIRSRADRLGDPLRVLAVVQLVMGGLAILSLGLFIQSFTWTAVLLQAVNRSGAGYLLFTAARYALCLLIMLPATFCAGMTLPLMTRMLMQAGGGERSIGAIYGANTLGAIGGTALTGLVLLPVVGLRGALVFGGALDMLLGLLALAALASAGRRVRGLAFGGSAALAALAAVALLVFPWDQTLLSSGVFRSGVLPRATDRAILFHEDGRTATVHAARTRVSGTLVIQTNGKPDGSLSVTWFEPCDTNAARRAFTGDDGTQALLPLVLLAHAPGARTGAVIGHGTGMSTHFLLGTPRLESLTTIEIEPAMVRGSQRFMPANRRAFEDPRSTLVIEDAKAFFAAAGRIYDLILSEPSNPWVSGVSGLFTSEFYHRIRQYMAPGGVFGQWLQTYELSDGLVLGVLAALHESFADYRVYLMTPGDLLVVATTESSLPAPDWSVFALPDVARDLCRFTPITPGQLGTMAVLDRAALAPLIDRGVSPNSDFFPVLDLGAERARFLRQEAAGLSNLGTGVVPYQPGVVARSVPPDGAVQSALLLVPSVRAVLQGAALRRVPGSVPDSAWLEGPDAAIRQMYGRFLQSTAGATPPYGWRAWTAEFWVLYRGLHSAVHGWPDSTFFTRAEGYAARARAPEPVLAAIAFAHRLAALDYAPAAAASEPLVREAEAGRAWLPVDELLDGAVVAHLAAGRAADARRVYDALRPRAARLGGDLRFALLNSYIERMLAAAP